MSECGFCFLKNDNNQSFERTVCLRINENDLDYSRNGLCSKDYNQNSSLSIDSRRPMFTFNYCPSNYAYLIIIGLVFYLIVFASGLGSQPWVVNSEIFPLNYRSACFSLTVAVNWLSNTFVSLTFLSSMQLLTESGTFLVYFFFSFCGLIYFYFKLPETRNLKLEEIEKLFCEAKSDKNKN